MRLGRSHVTRWVLGIAAACAPLVSALAAQPQTRTASPSTTPYRQLAPGVEITISPNHQEGETVSTADVIEILKGIPNLEWKPKFSSETRTLKEMATQTQFRREIWCLEFTFKPVRTIWVDVPQRSGKMQRKLIWYLLYHVRNTGGSYQPARQDDGTYLIKPVDRELRFFPQFVLESHEYQKAYLDRIIPVAVAAIQQKEDPNRKLLNSVEIGSQLIPVSTDLVDKSVWGVATWEDVDPRVDFFSVFVEGLTNAYQWTDPATFKAGDAPTTGRTFLQKNLMLNFWRPGDEYQPEKQTTRFGIPGKVDYSWVYR